MQLSGTTFRYFPSQTCSLGCGVTKQDVYSARALPAPGSRGESGIFWHGFLLVGQRYYCFRLFQAPVSPRHASIAILSRRHEVKKGHAVSMGQEKYADSLLYGALFLAEFVSLC